MITVPKLNFEGGSAFDKMFIDCNMSYTAKMPAHDDVDESFFFLYVVDHFALACIELIANVSPVTL